MSKPEPQTDSSEGTPFHCITCSDQALPVTVVSVDDELSMALAELAGAEVRIDVSLVDDVQPGDILLSHGGIALGRIETARAVTK